MPNGYTSPLSFMFFFKEIGKGKGGTGGTVAVPVNADAGDIHIPFNPMEEMGFTIPLWKQIKMVLMGDIIESTFSTGGKEDGVQDISNVVYHAPFLLAKIFPLKTVGTWVDDEHATLAMSAALANFVGTPESIGLHVHADDKDTDSTADIDANLFGGMVEEYQWSFKVDDILRESAKIRYSNVQAGAVAFNSASTFQNGRYAMWNDTWITDSRVRGIPFSALTISTYTALDNAIKIKGGFIKIEAPRQSEAVIDDSEGNASTDVRTTWKVTMSLDVIVIDDEIFTQSIAKFEDRTDATGKVLWTSGAFSEYIQCTKMKMVSDGQMLIKNAKENPQMEQNITFEMTTDAVTTFAGLYDQSEVPDPSSYV